MGRKEFNERLDDLNFVRKSLQKGGYSSERFHKDPNLKKIEKEINHLKLLHQI